MKSTNACQITEKANGFCVSDDLGQENPAIFWREGEENWCPHFMLSVAGGKHTPEMSSLRPVSWMRPAEALYPALVIAGLPSHRRQLLSVAALLKVKSPVLIGLSQRCPFSTATAAAVLEEKGGDLRR